jgi:hypothetical protein
MSCNATTCSLPSLAGGTSVTLVASLTFFLDVPDVTGSDQLFFSVGSATFDPNQGDNSATEQVAVRPRTADISVHVHGSTVLTDGEVGASVVTVTNLGPEPALEVLVAIDGLVGPGATLASHNFIVEPLFVECSGACLIPSLPAGATVSFVAAVAFALDVPSVGGIGRLSVSATLGNSVPDTFDHDLSNNSAVQQVAVRPIVTDTTGPAVVVQSPAAGSIFDVVQTVPFHYTADDPATVASSFATLDGAAIANGTAIDMSALGEGTHTIVVTASDGFGNVSTGTVAFEVHATPLGLVREARAQLVTLLAAATRKQDANTLSDAAASLADALVPANWVDANRLDPQTGKRVFDRLKDTAAALERLAADRHAQVSTTGVDTTLAELVRSAHDLAASAIVDARSHDASAKRLAAAQDALAEGDDALTSRGPADAIGHYRNAWQSALESVSKI